MFDVKICSKCKQELPVSMFHRNQQTPDGLHRYCKTCRGTKTPRGTQERPPVKEHIDVWFDEFRLVVSCVICEAAIAPRSFETVKEAKSFYREHAPLCDACERTTLGTRAKMRVRSWFRRVEDIFATVDVYHDVTSTLNNAPSLRLTNGADRWLAGERDVLTEEMMVLVQTKFEYRQPASVIHELNQRIPFRNLRDMKLDRKREICQARFGFDAEGNSLLDLALDA